MRIRNSAVTLGLSISLICLPCASLADTVTGDKGGDMLIDLIVMRPLGLATTVVGSAVFVLGLPFTLPSGSVSESACELVKRPAAYTFARPLGEFNACFGVDCTTCTPPETRGHD